VLLLGGLCHWCWLAQRIPNRVDARCEYSGASKPLIAIFVVVDGCSPVDSLTTPTNQNGDYPNRQVAIVWNGASYRGLRAGRQSAGRTLYALVLRALAPETGFLAGRLSGAAIHFGMFWSSLRTTRVLTSGWDLDSIPSTVQRDVPDAAIERRTLDW
jgi:hypothetical protein